MATASGRRGSACFVNFFSVFSFDLDSCHVYLLDLKGVRLKIIFLLGFGGNKFVKVVNDDSNGKQFKAENCKNSSYSRAYSTTA